MSGFNYFGHFFQLTIGEDEYSCRSTLEIVRLGSDIAALEPSRLLDRQPCAVFVMLNPGGSRPCDGRQPINALNDPRQIAEQARSNLVLTCPDATQRAIEKVMDCKQLDHARVLNLLDIRNTESNEIYDTIASLPEDRPPYSIFSPQRQGELTDRLGGDSQIVIVAWTVEGKCTFFFKECYQTLDDGQRRVFGWEHKKSPQCQRRFRHPGRNHKKWARKICERWP